MIVGVLVAVALVGIWWFTGQRHPIRRCPSCNGTKKNAGSNDQRWGTCRRCKGKGEIRRFGGW